MDSLIFPGLTEFMEKFLALSEKETGWKGEAIDHDKESVVGKLSPFLVRLWQYKMKLENEIFRSTLSLEPNWETVQEYSLAKSLFEFELDFWLGQNSHHYYSNKDVREDGVVVTWPEDDEDPEEEEEIYSLNPPTHRRN